MNRNKCQRRLFHGFTLIEVMVALTIIAVALGALIKASGSYTSIAGRLKNKTLAHYVAMNEITRLQIEKTWPDLGKKHDSIEMAGAEWFWTREVTKMTYDEKGGTARQVKYTIYESEAREYSITSVETSVLNPKVQN